MTHRGPFQPLTFYDSIPSPPCSCRQGSHRQVRLCHGVQEGMGWGSAAREAPSAPVLKCCGTPAPSFPQSLTKGVGGHHAGLLATEVVSTFSFFQGF